MVAEEADVVLQRLEVRVRVEVLGKVRGIIPDIQLTAYLRPAADGIRRTGVVGAVGDRVRGATAGTHPDGDIVPGMRQLGRLGRVLIRQRVEGDFREFRLQCLRNGVDEADQRAGRRAFLLVDRPAGRAGAVGADDEAVILRDRHQPRLRIVTEPRADALDHNAQDIGVGQAGLTVQVLCSPFAVDQRVVFGVFGEILFRREQQVEGMHEVRSGVADAAADFGCQMADVLT